MLAPTRANASKLTIFQWKSTLLEIESSFVHVFHQGDVHLADIVDQNNRTGWITEKVKLAKSQFMDGIYIVVMK